MTRPRPVDFAVLFGWTPPQARDGCALLAQGATLHEAWAAVTPTLGGGGLPCALSRFSDLLAAVEDAARALPDEQGAELEIAAATAVQEFWHALGHPVVVRHALSGPVTATTLHQGRRVEGQGSTPFEAVLDLVTRRRARCA